MAMGKPASPASMRRKAPKIKLYDVRVDVDGMMTRTWAPNKGVAEAAVAARLADIAPEGQGHKIRTSASLAKPDDE